MQWHAKARLQAGANFYIVGRDPAGMPHPDPEPKRGPHLGSLTLAEVSAGFEPAYFLPQQRFDVVVLALEEEEGWRAVVRGVRVRACCGVGSKSEATFCLSSVLTLSSWLWRRRRGVLW